MNVPCKYSRFSMYMANFSSRAMRASSPAFCKATVLAMVYDDDDDHDDDNGDYDDNDSDDE
jgi:hypothetical protein